MNANRIAVLIASLSFLAACGGGTPEPASPSTTASPSGAAAPIVAAKPDQAKLVTHLKEHVKYPVARGELLKACADTAEFTAGEKKWFEANLPEGTYKSADEASSALKL